MKFTHIIHGIRVQIIRDMGDSVYVITEYGEHAFYEKSEWKKNAERLPREGN